MELKSKYDVFIRSTIETICIGMNTDPLIDDEIKTAIDYIIHETIKDEKLKIILEKNSEMALN